MGSGKKQVYTFQNLIAPAPPESEASRINQQSLRVRLLRGMQEPDVENEIAKNFAPEVAYDLTYNPDLSSNVFLECWQQLAIAYDTYPNVSIDGNESLSTIITPDLWPLCQTRQLTQIAVNEAVIRLDWPSNENELQEVKYRVVSPNMIYGARSSKADPSQPDYVCELRVRTKENADGCVDVYTFETWDVSDPDDPKFSIHEEVEGELVDVTSYYVGEVEDYPYRDRDGAPILPYVFYHKKIQSQLWDWQNGIEVVKGTLRLAAGFTFFWDSFLNASSPVRVAIDLDLPAGNGLQMRNGGALQQVVYSPKTIIKMQSTVDRTGRIDTFPVGMSPEEGLEALRSYAERLAMYCGISGADLQTKNSGAKSGIAIIVSRDGMRRAQMRAEPANRKGDQIMLARAAKLSNAYGGTNLPEEPREYRISYALIGQSPFERKEELANVEKELSMNLISQVDATRRLYPEIESEEEAVGYLLAIEEQNQALAEAKVNTVSGQLDATESQGAREIVEAVAAGKLPPLTGVQMLVSFFGMSEDVAAGIIGTLNNFQPVGE